MVRLLKKCIIAVLTIALLTGCSSKLYTEGDASGYSLIYDIDGVSFGMADTLSQSATAVTNISQNMTFELDQAYLYKDGESEYLLFNISSYIVAAQKGTTFNVAAVDDKSEAITSNNLLGIWFDIPKKKLEYSDNTADGVYKLMADVNAEVSITSELFNDFTGKLCIISNGTEEWSLFVGASGTNYDAIEKESKEIIEYMAASLKCAEKEIQKTEAAVSLGGSNTEETENTEESAIEEASILISDDSKEQSNNDSSVNDTSLALSSDDIIEESNIESSEEQDSKTEPEEDIVEIIEETSSSENDSVTDASSNEDAASKENSEISEEETIINIESEDEDSNKEESSQPEAQPEETLDTTEDEIKRGDNIKLNNQKQEERDDDTVYSSSLYDMLPLNKWGKADILSKKNLTSSVALKISDLKTEDDAEKIIQKAINSSNVPYMYFDPPLGCSWHLVKVTILSESAEYLQGLDIKMVGADGNELKFRGIKYSSRTYNIPVSDTEKYVYYAVPNGCEEYVLQAGDGTNDNEISNAYYLIKKGDY